MGKDWSETVMSKLVNGVYARFEDEAGKHAMRAEVLEGNPEAVGVSQIEAAALILGWFHGEVKNGGLEQWEGNGYDASAADLHDLLDEALEDQQSMAIRAVQDILTVINRKKISEMVKDAFDTCYYAIEEQFLDDMDQHFREWFGRLMQPAEAAGK